MKRKLIAGACILVAVTMTFLPAVHAGSASAKTKLPRRSAAPHIAADAAALQGALLKRNAMLATPAHRPASLLAGGSNPLALNWTEIGPGSVGGRINVIWVDPANAQHFVVGAAGGGLWQSLDSGQTWASMASFPGTLAIGGLVSPAKGVLLAGTGDGFNESQSGIGVVRSVDGGATWTPVAGTAPSAKNPDWYYVNNMAGSSAGVVLAATGANGVSADYLNTTFPGIGSGGVYRSKDQGQNWSKVWPSDGSSNTFYAVAFDPGNPNVAVASGDGGVVVYSTDGGATWNNASGMPATGGRAALAFDPGVKGSVYAISDNSPGVAPSGQLYHSTDGGKSWSLLADTTAFVNVDSNNAVGAVCDDATGGTASCQGDYDIVLTVVDKPGAPPTIVVGGINVFSSTNGGASFTETGSWLTSDANYVHADHHALVSVNGQVYSGNDGGIFALKPDNTWKALNNGLAITQFYAISGHEGAVASKNIVNGAPITPILAGAQDNGMLLYQGYSSGGTPQPNNWVEFVGGDGVGASADPADGNFLYGSYPNLDLSYSTTGGPSGQDFAIEPTDFSNAPPTANFGAPFTLIPNGSLPANAMLAGGAKLWRGTSIQSGSPHWTSINGTTLPVAAIGNHNYISTISIDPANASNVWVGYDDGEVWHSTNATSATPAWAASGTLQLPSGQSVTSFWVVAGTTTVYVTFNGFPSGGNNIFVSNDGGSNWKGIGASLPAGPAYSLVTNPNNAQWLYVGTMTGVYASQDGGTTWTTSNLGPANVAVNQLTWFSTGLKPVLLAATSGRGAWMGAVQYSPLPVISSLSQTQINAATATSLNILGSGFQPGSIVSIDGTAVAASYVSSAVLNVIITASQFTTAGTHAISVSNPAPGGGSSGTAVLTVVSNTPATPTTPATPAAPAAPSGHSGGGATGMFPLGAAILLGLLRRRRV